MILSSTRSPRLAARSCARASAVLVSCLARRFRAKLLHALAVCTWGLFFAALPVIANANEGPQVTREELRDAQAAMKAALREGDSRGFLGAFDVFVATGNARVLRSALADYENLAETVAERSWTAFYELHRDMARALGRISEDSLRAELEKQRSSRRTGWRVKLALLDAAALARGADLRAVALEALADEDLPLVRRALDYLRNTKRFEDAQRIVERFVEVEEERTGSERERERTLLAFQSALQSLFGIDLAAAIDWRNYVEARKNRPDPFARDDAGSSARTGLTLFGAGVTGKNIAFILDVSGSMLTTDPAPPGKGGTTRPRTRVIGQPDPGPPKIPEERRRISRAKTELARVIRALPSEVRFNVIAYSSEVVPWKKSMVSSSSANKDAAVEFVDGLAAEGITVTDLALEEAFADLQLDTVYLVTDGAPTHIGSQTRALPPDALELIESIHERVGELNFLRAVRIFTLGFPDAKEDFLQKLSRDHGGSYVAIE